MADDVHTIQTSFGDVAELGKGYLKRVDGQRILLPLAKEVDVGDGVRYVVHLADGTPAFAGAGRCVEVSDQGRSAPKGQRYETMLEALQFDDRSRPVYEYIVAIRNATYGEGRAVGATDGGAPVEDATAGDEAELLDADEPATAGDDEATAFIGRPGTRGSARPETDAGGSFAGAIEQVVRSSAPAAAPERASRPSLTKSVMPTGALRRPALGLQWQPAPPEHPTPRAASGRFVYPEGGLPRPAHAPYPDLDPSRWVRPAPRP